MPRTLPDFRPGDEVDHRDFRSIVDAIKAQRIIGGQGCGLDIQETDGGTSIRVSAVGPQWRIAVANGDIPAATKSGGTWTFGAGSVFAFKVTAGDQGAAGATSIAVMNPSRSMMSSGNGIDDGQLCMISETTAGVTIVVPLECS